MQHCPDPVVRDIAANISLFDALHVISALLLAVHIHSLRPSSGQMGHETSTLDAYGYVLAEYRMNKST